MYVLAFDIDVFAACNSCRLSLSSSTRLRYVEFEYKRKDGNGELDVHPDLLREDTVRCDLLKWRISSHALDNHVKGLQSHTSLHGVMLDDRVLRKVVCVERDVMFVLFAL